MSSFRDWVEQGTTLKKVANTSGSEYAGPCPWCGGKDRFRAWLKEGRYWCRQCNRKGDAIQFLMDFCGLNFRDACRAVGREILPRGSPEYQARKRHQAALAAAKAAFDAWVHKKFIEYTDRHRELLAERETCLIAFRLVWRRPGFLAEEEAEYWKRRMSEVSDQLASLSWDCDFFTFNRYEGERLNSWKERRE